MLNGEDFITAGYPGPVIWFSEAIWDGKNKNSVLTEFFCKVIMPDNRQPCLRVKPIVNFHMIMK